MKRYSLPKEALPDLKQEGFLGLWKATETYDPQKGAFSTYAYKWIWGMIRKHLNRSGLIRYSDQEREEIQRYLYHKIYLREELNREPRLEEMIDYTGYSIEEIEELELTCRSMQDYNSIEAPVYENHEIKDFIVGYLSPRSEQIAYHKIISEILEPLPLQEKEMIMMYYGLKDDEYYSTREISAV